MYLVQGADGPGPSPRSRDRSPIPAEDAPAGVATTVSLSHLMSILRRRIGWLIVALLLGLAAGIGFIALNPPRYIATAQIIVDPRGLRVLDNAVQPSAESSDALTNVVESEMRVIKAADVLDRVIDQLHLDRDDEFNGTRTTAFRRVTGAVKAALATLVGAPVRPEADPRTKALAALDERLALRRIERSFVVEVSMLSEDPRKSALIANTVVDVFVARSAEEQAETARRSGEALNGNLDDMQSRVKVSEDAVEQFKAAHSLVGTGGRLLSDQQLGELGSQLTRAKAQVAEAQARVDQLARAKQGGGAPFEGAQPQTIAPLRVQLAEVKRRYASLESQLGPRHPDLAEVSREVRQAQGSIDAEIDRLAQTAHNDLARAREAERLTQAEIDGLSRVAMNAGKASVQLRELERKADASRSVYNAALVRSRQLQEQALLNSTNIRHVAPAMVPDRPAGPPAALVLALALAGGLGLGGAGAVALDLRKGRSFSPTDLARVSGLPVLAAVQGTWPDQRRGAADRPAELAAYLDIVDALQLSRPGAPEVLAVASPEGGPTSGAVALGLARAVAGLGAKVLLIDCALEERTLTRRMDAEQRPGLGACSARHISIGDVSVPIAGTAVTLVPADKEAAQDLRQIGGGGLPGLVRQALASHALVVLDLGSAAHEALPLVGGAADVALLAVDRGRSGQKAVQAAIAAMTAAKLSPAGAVLAGCRTARS